MNHGTRTAPPRTTRVWDNVEAYDRSESDMRDDAEETLNRCAWDTKAKRHARDVLALLERLEGERKG